MFRAFCFAGWPSPSRRLGPFPTRDICCRRARAQLIILGKAARSGRLPPAGHRQLISAKAAVGFCAGAGCLGIAARVVPLCTRVHCFAKGAPPYLLPSVSIGPVFSMTSMSQGSFVDPFHVWRVPASRYHLTVLFVNEFPCVLPKPWALQRETSTWCTGSGAKRRLNKSVCRDLAKVTAESLRRSPAILVS